MCIVINNFDSLVQECSISSALAMEILQSCTKPSIYHNFSNDVYIHSSKSSHWCLNKGDTEFCAKTSILFEGIFPIASHFFYCCSSPLYHLCSPCIKSSILAGESVSLCEELSWCGLSLGSLISLLSPCCRHGCLLHGTLLAWDLGQLPVGKVQGSKGHSWGYGTDRDTEGLGPGTTPSGGGYKDLRDPAEAMVLTGTLRAWDLGQLPVGEGTRI